MQDHDLAKAEIWLDENLDAPNCVEPLVHKLGYSAVQIRRDFKFFFGLNPAYYRDQLRIEKAAKLLTYTNLSILDIGVICGYVNPPSFSRAFYRHFSTSPKKFRQKKIFSTSLNRDVEDIESKFTDFYFKYSNEENYLLVRHYGSNTINRLSLIWQKYYSILESKVDISPIVPVWFYNDHSPTKLVHGERSDIGILISNECAYHIAPPLPFRSKKVSGRRLACMQFHSLEDVDLLIEYLLLEALPEQNETISGDPPSVVWLHGRPDSSESSILELRVPLLD